MTSEVSRKKKQLIKRTTADQILPGVIERAKRINEDDRYLYGIKEISVFGSYLKSPDKEYIGDLDILVKTEPKRLSWSTGLPEEKAREIFFRYSETQAQKELPRGSFLNRLFYPHEKPFKTLKNRSRTLSIHDGDAESGRVGPERVVFSCLSTDLIIKRKIY